MLSNEVQDLIARARRGDRSALDLLLQRVQGRLTTLAHAALGPRLRCRVSTSDLVQSTFLEIVRSVERFPGRDESDFVRWVGRILRNTLLDKRRFFSARKRGGPGVAGELEGGVFPAPGPSPSAAAAFGEEVSRLSRAYARLAPDHRRVIELLLLDGRSTAEAAAALGRTEAATRVLLCRARAALMVAAERAGPPDAGGNPGTLPETRRAD